MSDFDNINAAAAASFNEPIMGEAFSYTSTAGTTTSGLVGVFNHVQAAYGFEDFSVRKTTDLSCVSSKPQWGAVVPATRGTITYNSVAYTIENIDGAATPGEPCYAFTLKLLT